MVLIKLQSNSTEITLQNRRYLGNSSHTNRAPPTRTPLREEVHKYKSSEIKISLIDGNKKNHIYTYCISLRIRWCLFYSWLPFSPLCCVFNAPIQNFSFSSTKLSISFSDKCSALFKTSIITKSKSLNGTWGSLHSSIKCLTILQVGLYHSYNFLIVVPVWYKTTHLVYYTFYSVLSIQGFKN